nr:MAG: ORF1 [Torque teno midi virus]
MAFWWTRRRKWWWRGRRRRYYKRKYKPRYKRKRFRRKRRYRKPTRRFSRRRKKVRRKLKKLTLKQWQPDCIRKCKIKGWAVACLGGQGKQFACYTDNRFDWTPATAPGGGGFGCETYSLNYLYQELKRGNNKWSFSNLGLELCRYTGGSFTFYRHKHLDFIIQFILEYPMTLNKYTYSKCHPYILLKSKHKRIIPSWDTKPYGSRKVRVKFKPPKLMSTKWFFQEELAAKPLIQLNSAVASLNYSYLGCCNTNELTSFYALNLQFYTHSNWGLFTGPDPGTPYKPLDTLPQETKLPFTGKTTEGKSVTGTIDRTGYKNSVNIDTGWFQPKLLSIAYELKFNTTGQLVIPLTVGRYNPTIDTGDGNKVWLISVTKDGFGPPKTDTSLILEDLPLWQLLMGFTDYVQKIKGDSTFLQNYCLVLTSRFIFPHHSVNNYWLILDKTFITGKGPYGEFVPKWSRDHWYPTVEHQQETINAIVLCGPYVPKLDNQKLSTWELKYNYNFYFKWGGAQPPDQTAADPARQGKYDPPNMLSEAVQIINPSKQIPQAVLHSWDYRRGIVTSSALKRMREDAETDTSFQSISESTPKKKKKYPENALQDQQKEDQALQTCLLNLFKEDTFQDPQTQDLHELILNQQQQQQQLKNNLLCVIANLKKQQQQLQLQTGFLS